MVKKLRFSPVFFFSILSITFAFILLEITIYRQVHQISFTNYIYLPRPTSTPTQAPKANNFCGGIANIQCPAGFDCLITEKYPDAGGTCVPQQLNKQFSFIKKLYLKDGQYFIDADYAEMLNDDIAPNGYRIQNNNPQIRTLKLSPDIQTFIIDYNVETLSAQVSFTQFQQSFDSRPPYWLYLDSSNQVVKIEQQYLP